MRYIMVIHDAMRYTRTITDRRTATGYENEVC